MTNDIQLRQASESDRERIVDLLQSEKLPTGDIPASLGSFIIAVHNEQIVGAIGLEQYQDGALLRSLIVNPSYRRLNIAGSLVSQLEERALALGINCMYLLTETAPLYFEKKGYQVISREEVPDSVKQSTEFSHVCPASAIVMKKSIIKGIHANSIV